MSSFNFKPVSQSEKTKPIFEKPKNCNKLAQKVYKIVIASRKPKKCAPASKQITSYFPNGHNGHNLQVHRFFGLTY